MPNDETKFTSQHLVNAKFIRNKKTFKIMFKSEMISFSISLLEKKI